MNCRTGDAVVMLRLRRAAEFAFTNRSSPRGVGRISTRAFHSRHLVAYRISYSSTSLSSVLASLPSGFHTACYRFRLSLPEMAHDVREHVLTCRGSGRTYVEQDTAILRTRRTYYNVVSPVIFDTVGFRPNKPRLERLAQNQIDV